MKNLFAALLLVAAFAATGSAQKVSSTAETAAMDAIRAVMDAQAKAWNAGDIDAFMSGYWRSPKMTFVSGDSVSRGWQAALDRYKKNYDSKAKMGTLTFSELEIKVISKNYATVLGRWSLARENDNPQGRFTLIFRKFKNGWLIIHDHSS